MKKNKLLNKIIASILLLVFNINLLANNLTLDPNSRQNTSLDVSQNGVPIVNTATPNGRGISVNDFLEYNVGREGQVLNNADNLGRSYIAGLINANPNLGANQAANLIILQVNGANKSQIEGYIEALSREKVNVILSNQNGLFFDGAGTINIKNFIPTTGKVNLKDGEYIGIDVEKGHVLVGLSGLDIKNIDYVNIIAKSLELQGNIVGENQLDVTLGENSVDENNNITKKSTVKSQSVAIDASQLGGMYAGQIRIISTDKGAGVNSRSFIVSRDKKLEITADGKVVVNKVQGSGIDIKGTSYEQKELGYSDKEIDITAQDIKLSGTGTQALEDINLNGNVENSAKIYTDKNLNTKDLINSGEIQVGENLKTNDITNSGDILVLGKQDSNNIENTGKILINETLNAEDVKTTKTLITGKDITIKGLENIGVVATNENIRLNGSLINKGTVEGKNLSVKGIELTNSGDIKVNNIVGTVNTTKNDGLIFSNNDIDLTINTLDNTNQILALNNIDAKTTNITNSAKIASNQSIKIDNTNLNNTGEILSSKVSLQNLVNYQNTGTIKGDKTTLSVNNNINLTGVLHGEQVLSISGQNITNNGVTTGKGLIDIKSNDFTNNEELAGNAVQVKATGDIENNSIITGNYGYLEARNLTNNDLIAFDKDLGINVVNKVENNKDKSIYGGDNLEIKASEILNDEAEILGGNIDLKAKEITNNVGLIQATGDIEITSDNFKNIGRVTDLDKYTKYYITWDGIRLSEDEAKVWGSYKLNKHISKQRRERPIQRKQAAYYQELLSKKDDLGGYSSLILSKYSDIPASKLGERVNITFSTRDAIIGEIALEGKLESHSVTEYGKVLASGDITINSTNTVNKDGIISAGGITRITGTTLENSVTIGNAVQLQNGEEKVRVNLKKTKQGWHRYYLADVDYSRNLYNADLGYTSGQPSVIEGSVVDIKVPNIVESSIPEANGIINEGNNNYGQSLFINKNLNINTGQSNTNPSVQVAGNTTNVQNLINTGIIAVNPLTNSAMFTQNVNPSSKYLMETRSKYISLNQYYGSDYFLSRIGYSEIWDRTKKLGDAYYENQLLTRAISERLGTAFIDGKSNQELIKDLMDNAGDEARRQNLKVGTALTREQINNLEDSIIWYVEQEVNGIKVLIPQIYLAQTTIATINTDTRNRVGGINGTYIKTDDLVNVGTKIGNGGTTYVEANSVKNMTTTNQLSEITGDRTVILTKGNIENTGGLINGENQVILVSEDGDILNNSTKRENSYNNGEYDRGKYEEIASMGAITSETGIVAIKGKNYTSEAGALVSDNLILDVESVNLKNIELTGEDKHGSGSKDFFRYSEKENVGAIVQTNTLSGNIDNLNITGSSLIAEDTTGLRAGNIDVQSVVNEYETEEKRSSKDFLKKSSSYTSTHTEENVASNLKLGKNAIITGDMNVVGSNVLLGENTYVGGKVTTDSQELNNTYYHEEKKSGVTGGISGSGFSVGYGKSKTTYDEKSTVNAKSNLQIGDGSVLNNGADITATNFEYGQIQINDGEVKYGARKDTVDIKQTSSSSFVGVSASINSPALDRAKQVSQAVNQARQGDKLGAGVGAVNIATGVVSGMSGNITKPDGSRATMKDIVNGNFKVNNDFYLSGKISAGVNKTKTKNTSHQESAVVTTMKPLDDNSSITYNNVNNITYEGTQAENGTFVYNNVANIKKEAVELNNSYSSKSTSSGIGVSASLGADMKVKDKGVTLNISTSGSNQNTNETIYENGTFTNVNEVHNNTQNMTLDGFNQTGGVVRGVIKNLEVNSKQNTSKTDGYSYGVNVGIGLAGSSSSLDLSGSTTNGNRNFVDNQSSFVVGAGSNLVIGNAKNIAGIIGTEENARLKIDNYEGYNLENDDELETVGGSIGLGGDMKNRTTSLTGVGVNLENRDKEGVTRNTVIGNVEIGQSSGDEINRDLNKENEVTKDKASSTNVYLESQTINYLLNPTQFKEDLEVAILEGKATGETVLKTIENYVNGRENSDISEPERRSLNEIKEVVIRVKTAPEMKAIAESDLNSQEVLDLLKISGIEKYDPDDTELPENVRKRLNELAEKGLVPGAFYDKTTNKIFLNEYMEDEAEIRALVAREWKISEDLKAGKGKENEEGQLKSTVAGEIAYDDIMKRAGDGKTEEIDISVLSYAIMDENSEITSDFTKKHIDNFFAGLGRAGQKLSKGDFKGAYNELRDTGAKTKKVLSNDINNIKKGGSSAKKPIKETTEAVVSTVVPKKTTKSTKNKSKQNSQKGTKKEALLNAGGEILEKGLDVTKNIAVETVYFGSGMSGAISQDLTYGAYKPLDSDKPSYLIGSAIGHGLTTIAGLIGTEVGSSMAGLGTLASPVTGVLSLGVSATGVAVAGYSSGVAVNGVKGVIESTVKLSNSTKNSNYSSSNGSSETKKIAGEFTENQIKDMSLDELTELGTSNREKRENIAKFLKGTEDDAIKFFESRISTEGKPIQTSKGEVRIGKDKFENKIVYRGFSSKGDSYPTIDIYDSEGLKIRELKFDINLGK